MITKRNTLLAFTVAAAGILGAGSLWAHEGDQDGESSSMHQEMMQDGMGVMNMMGEMESMMEKCNSMMDMMQQEHRSSTGSDQADN